MTTRPTALTPDAVPDGWKLVPVNPARGMRGAGAAVFAAVTGHPNWDLAHEVWNLMLAAAPAPPENIGGDIPNARENALSEALETIRDGTGASAASLVARAALLATPPPVAKPSIAETRMRAYLLEELDWALRHNGSDGELVALLSELPAEDAWRPFTEVTDAQDDEWFLWRVPATPDDLIHADQVAAENGRIDVKHGCGLDFYTECARFTMPPDVAELLARSSQGG